MLWGATPGTNDANLSKYTKMQEGDYVFFAGNKHLFAGATVTHTFRNRALAQQLWGTDDKGQTWELMFALDELRAFGIPYAEMNRAVGYNEKNIVQGFTVLDTDRSAALFDLLTLDSDRHPAAPNTTALADLLDRLPAHTEAEVTTVRRLEQGFLRRMLLPGEVGICDLCGDELPVEFLVAAHIKKRAQCTNAERLNIPTIAMVACKFGCDALFEAGFIGVRDFGKIEVSPLAPTGGAAASYLQRLAHRTCAAYTAQRVPYFDWHWNHTYKQ